MKLLFSIIMILFWAIMILMTMITILNKRKQYDHEKSSPFECGFDPLAKPRTPFSIQFYTTTLMFLIFDVEIAIIMPIPMTKMINSFKSWTMLSSLIFLTLMLGMVLEWKEGSMNWK